MTKSIALKPILLASLTTALLSACNSGGGSTTPVKSQTMASPQVKAAILPEASVKLGNPLLRYMNLPVRGGANAVVINDNTKISVGPTLHAEKGYKNDTSLRKMMASLGIDGSLAGGYKDVKGNFKAKYDQQTEEEAKSIQYVFYGQADGEFCLADHPELANDIKLTSVKDYGDSYVNCTRAGLYTGVVITLTFDNAHIKNIIEASGDINASSFLTLAGSIKKLDENYKINSKIDILTQQFGGDVSQIFKIYDQKDSGESPELSCGVEKQEDADKCMQILYKMDQYMSGKPTNMDDDIVPFSKQVDEYLVTPHKEGNFNTLKDMNMLYGFEATSAGVYKTSGTSATEYKPDSNLQEKLLDLDNLFQDSDKTFRNARALVSLVGVGGLNGGNTFNATVNTLKKDLATAYQATPTCYGPMIEKKDIDDCVKLIDKYTAKLAKDVQDLNDSNPYSFYITEYSLNEPVAYMIAGPVSDDFDEISQDYLTYSTNPLSSRLIPGIKYKFESNGTKEGKLTSQYSNTLKDFENSIQKEHYRFEADTGCSVIDKGAKSQLACMGGYTYFDATNALSTAENFSMPQKMTFTKYIPDFFIPQE